MAARGKAKEAKARKSLEPRASRKKYDPGAGPWSVSYGFVDRGAGEFAWPSANDETGIRLMRTLSGLTEHPFEAVENMVRETGGTAHKEVDPGDLIGELQDRLNDILPRIGRDTDFVIYEFTYCYRKAAPERIWAAYDGQRRCMYPLWWDPKHQVCGFNDQFAGRAGGPCPENCPHPPD